MKLHFSIINMRIYSREIRHELRKAAGAFGALILTGPRRSGKTFLLRRTFPKASYHLLEDPDVIGRIKADPRGWMESVRTPAILDEVQNVPELFAYVRSHIDMRGGRSGQWFITGSQDLSLMQGVTESMAGRAAVFSLLPLSYRETGSWNLIRGGFPEVVLRPRGASIWFNSYIQTYLERDVRALKAVKDLSTFRRFMAMVAARHGQILNRTDIAAPLGVSVPTVSEWLGVLETTGQIVLVPPFYENFGKRLIKSPKLYWLDSGLVCFLLRIENERQLENSPFLGAVFEGFLAAEIIKKQINTGRAREIYFFRDAQGLEVDFLVPRPGGGMQLIEAKWAKTITPAMTRPLTALKLAIKKKNVEALIVHRAPAHGERLRTVVPGVGTLSVEEFLSES
jgi:predicted AAA+ superfamily ATPase